MMRNQPAQHFPPAAGAIFPSSEPPTIYHDDAASQYLHHSWGTRVNTAIVITETLRRQYSKLHLTVAPAGFTSLLAYAQTGHAEFHPLIPDNDPVLAPITERRWIAPAQRNGGEGALVDRLVYGKYAYKWQDHDFIVYVVDGRDGTGSYPVAVNNYILSTDPHKADALIAAASSWFVQLHNEIWVFDQGFWQKSGEMWQSIQGSEWADVILDEDMKKAIRRDIEDFYDSRESYKRLNVPWKRGLIFHGPPGNGKTISIKATMHQLLRREEPVPTLYVRSIASYMGPEYAVKQIFGMARRQAPCFLVFEDLDSIVTDQIRSYFLNEVDGLQTNDGILMVGSTNHLERLDPGLSKRPSRFDRKYLFPDPNLAQRTSYVQFWQSKMAKSPDVSFPDKLCPAVASITDGFSFAYIQEAFVAALLALARKDDTSVPDAAPEPKPDSSSDEPDYGGLTQAEAADEYVKLMQRLREKKAMYAELLKQMEAKSATSEASAVLVDEPEDDEPDLDDLPLWRELKKQVAILREGMDDSGRFPTYWQGVSEMLPARMPPGMQRMEAAMRGMEMPSMDSAEPAEGPVPWTGTSPGLLEQMREHVGPGRDGLTRLVVDH